MKLTKKLLKQMIKEEVTSLSEMLHPYHPMNEHIAAILKMYRMQRPEDQGSMRQAIRELLSLMEQMSGASNSFLENKSK